MREITSFLGSLAVLSLLALAGGCGAVTDEGPRMLHIEASPPPDEVSGRAPTATVEATARASPVSVDGVRVQAPGEWVLIKAGSFTMGSPASEPGRGSDEAQHRVRLTRDFWLQATEVTQGQWLEMMGDNPSLFMSCGSSCPVEDVTWYEAAAYCNVLSKREGLPECYDLSGCRTTPSNRLACDAVPFEGLDCPGYRLPTETEWEHAARAGTTTALYTGSIEILGERNAPALDPIAWYGGNSGVSYSGGYDCSGEAERQQEASRCGTHPAKGKRPNGWGLYDMLGNVWEWCHDWYDSYPPEVVTDPVGPATGKLRVFRGGSCTFVARYTRSAARLGLPPGNRYSSLGLRPARTKP